MSFLRDLAIECLANSADKRPEASDIAGRLKDAIDDMKEDNNLQFENKQHLVQSVTELRQQVDQNGHWKKTSLFLMLLLLLFFIMYLFHWINICHECDGCSSRMEQDCLPLLKLEDTTMTMLGSARNTLYLFYRTIRG